MSVPLLSVIGLILILSHTATAITFKSINLTHPNGTDYELPSVIAVEFVPEAAPLTLLAATFSGTIHLLRVWHPKPFRYFCRQLAELTVPDGRSVLHITADPFTPHIFFVTTAIPGFTQRGLPPTAWNNGQVLVLKVSAFRRSGKMSLGTEPLLAGLPVPDNAFDVGLEATAAAADGSLFVFQALHTNAGAPGPPNFQEDSYYSGSVLTADIRTREKTRIVEWTSDVISDARPANGNESGISLYATGIRSVLSPVINTRGHLYISDGGADPPSGRKSVSCNASVPLAAARPDRMYRVRRGRWYGAANRARGQDDAKYCVDLWGNEDNLTDIMNTYPGLTVPSFNTAKARQDGTLRAGVVGFAQYLPNWFPSFRKKLIATEFDGEPPVPIAPGKQTQRPGMVGVNLWQRDVFKIADAPGESMAIDRYGSIFVAQVIIGKIAIAVPVVKQ